MYHSINTNTRKEQGLRSPFQSKFDLFYNFDYCNCQAKHKVNYNCSTHTDHCIYQCATLQWHPTPQLQVPPCSAHTYTEAIFHHNPASDTFVSCGLCSGAKFLLSRVFIIQSCGLGREMPLPQGAAVHQLSRQCRLQKASTEA